MVEDGKVIGKAGEVGFDGPTDRKPAQHQAQRIEQEDPERWHEQRLPDDSRDLHDPVDPAAGTGRRQHAERHP